MASPTLGVYPFRFLRHFLASMAEGVTVSRKSEVAMMDDEEKLIALFRGRYTRLIEMMKFCSAALGSALFATGAGYLSVKSDPALSMALKFILLSCLAGLVCVILGCISYAVATEYVEVWIFLRSNLKYNTSERITPKFTHKVSNIFYMVSAMLTLMGGISLLIGITIAILTLLDIK